MILIYILNKVLSIETKSFFENYNLSDDVIRLLNNEFSNNSSRKKKRKGTFSPLNLMWINLFTSHFKPKNNLHEMLPNTK